MQQIFGEVQVLSLITGLHHQSFTHQFYINRLNEIQDDGKLQRLDSLRQQQTVKHNLHLKA